MASGALPPAFPAVRIDGELYWDGGILSNTPTEAVFDDNPRQNSLIFSVHLWNPTGAEPTTTGRYSTGTRTCSIPAGSRARSCASSRSIVCVTSSTSSRRSCRRARSNAAVRELAGYGCQTRMHVVRLLAPQLDGETHTKDIDFSPDGIRQRWEAGYAHTSSVLARAPGPVKFDPLSAVVFHEHMETMLQAAE